jgi:hypothetical protein
MNRNKKQDYASSMSFFRQAATGAQLNFNMACCDRGSAETMLGLYTYELSHAGFKKLDLPPNTSPSAKLIRIVIQYFVRSRRTADGRINTRSS